MLAGLLFATHEAEDRSDRLVATLPFGGMTLVEYQARLLVAAGATQIVVVVARMTPELLGAINRITRRGAAVDAVRSAAEAVARLHPLARVVALADGLVTTDEVVAAMAEGDGGALLAIGEEEAAPGFERVGSGRVWAGVARLEPQCLAEVAALPRDYDVESALVRVLAQGGAAQLPLPLGATRDSHGIERRAEPLVQRGRGILAAIMAQRSAWFDRLVVAPIARHALPPLADRGLAGGVVAGVGVAGGLAGLATIMAGAPFTGTVLVLTGLVAIALGATLGWLRDEPRIATAEVIAAALLPALACLALGWTTSLATGVVQGNAAPLATAIGLVAVAALAERAAQIGHRRRRWWATPPAYLVLLLPFLAIGQAAWGLAAMMAYATATAAAAVERFRDHA